MDKGIATLLLRMTRWRVGIVLVVVMLLGAAWQGGFARAGWKLLVAAIALAASYACATTINDLADVEIDRINLQGDKDRPLVSGQAARGQMWRVAIVAGGLTLAGGILLGPVGIVLMLASVAVDLTYSLPPFKVSYRPYLTPFFLPLGYVVIPFLVGAVAAGRHPYDTDLLLMFPVYLLFAGRMFLKDLRDRKGDKAAGKPTFVLLHGKSATVRASIICASAGYILLLVSLLGRLGQLGWLTLVFATPTLFMLLRLEKVDQGRPEQLAIGVAAKMGNGILLTTLGLLVLQSAGASESTMAVFGLSLATLYAINFAQFLRAPDEARIVYKR